MENRSLSSQISALAKSLKAAGARMPFMKQQILLVVMGTFSVQGIVVERKNTRQFVVLRFSEVSFEASVRSPKARIARLMEALGPVTAKHMLVVTEDVRFLAADLPVPPLRRFGGMDMEKLKEGARWEIAPFLDYEGENALVNLVLLPEQEDIVSETDGFSDEVSPRQPALIFAAAPPVYAGYAAICKAYNKRLTGMMAEECFAFATGPCFEQTRDFLLMECRMHDVLGALIRNGLPVRIQRDTIEGGETAMTVIQRLAAELTEDGREVEEIIIGGEFAESESFPAISDSEGNTPVRAWRMEDDLPFLRTLGPLPARYMAAMGAALNYFNQKESRIQVDDSVPLKTRLKENVHTLPIVLLVVFLISIGGAYAHLNHKRHDLQQTVATLEAEKKQLKEESDNESSLKARYRRLKDEKSDLMKKTDLLLETIPEQNRKIAGLLDGIISQTPFDVHLNRFYQFSDAVFFVEGRTGDFSSITQYVVGLKNVSIVKEVRLENSQEINAGASSGRKSKSIAGDNTSAMYQFSIRIRLEG